MRNFNRRALARLGAGAAALCAAGALVGIAGPALAEEPANADLQVSVPGPKVAVNSAGKNVRIDVANGGPSVASDAKLTLEVADITDAVTVTLPGEAESCPTVSGKVVCDLGDLPAGGNEQTVVVFVKPQSGAAPGEVGTLKATVSSSVPDGFPADNTATVTLELVPDAADLVTYTADLSLAVGETGDLVFFIENTGSLDADFVDVAVKLPAFVRFAEELDHCEYQNGDPASAVCHYEGLPVDTGALDAFPIMLGSDAPGPQAHTGGTVAGIVVQGSPELATASSATKVKQARLASRPATLDSDDASPGDDTVSFTVFGGPNTIDLAVAAAAASGKVGDVVDVKVTFTNHGPAAGSATFMVKAPTGTAFVNTPDGELPDCWTPAGADRDFDFTEAAEATCGFEREFPPDTHFDQVLQFRIKSATIGDDGTVTVADGVGTKESNPADNVAAIAITVDGSGGGLPVTGVQVGVIGAVGVAVVALGVGLLLIARRRRVVTVAPEADE